MESRWNTILRKGCGLDGTSDPRSPCVAVCRPKQVRIDRHPQLNCPRSDSVEAGQDRFLKLDVERYGGDGLSPSVCKQTPIPPSRSENKKRTPCWVYTWATASTLAEFAFCGPEAGLSSRFSVGRETAAEFATSACVISNNARAALRCAAVRNIFDPYISFKIF